MYYFGRKQYLAMVFLLLCPTSYVRADTIRFICKNWHTSSFTFEGSFFIGQKTQEGYVIRNRHKKKIVIKFSGNYNNTGVKLYSGIDPEYEGTEFYAVSTNSAPHDFEIKQFQYLGENPMSQCNYE